MTISVIFEHVRSNSGVDVWVKTLMEGLKKKNEINTQIRYYKWYYSLYPRLIKKIKKNQFLYPKSSEDRVQHSNVDYSYIFKVDDTPLVSTAHHIIHREGQYLKYTSHYQKAYYKVLWRYQNNSLKISDVVTSVSEYTKWKLEEVFGYSDTKVIYNGVDIGLFKPLNIYSDKIKIGDIEIDHSDKIILLFSGNFNKRKGADILLRLINKIKKEKLDDKFTFIFTGLKRTSILNHLNTSNNFIIGLNRVSVQDLVMLYSISDIFIFPSRLEGFGLAIAEAMACKTPVISTGYSSIPELVVPDKGGILCDESINCFYESLLYLSQDENIRKKMGEFNRKRITNKFSLEIMADKYYKLYRKL